MRSCARERRRRPPHALSAVHPYRLGFAAKVLGGGGLRTHDSRRWQNEPHLSRSLDYLEQVFSYLERGAFRMFRLAGGTVPYGTHPDLPALDYRRQLDACAERLDELGARARGMGLRLSTHPGQYTVINGPEPVLTGKAALDLDQDAFLLDRLGQGPEAVVVVHVGGVYGDKPAALARWVTAYEGLTERARRRLVVENDETSYDVADVLELHRRTGAPVVFDWHHHLCNPAARLADPSEALAAACATWPAGVRPKVHVSSPRTELRPVQRRRAGGRGKETRLVPPLLDQHADFVSPWDVQRVLRAAPGPLDVMIEAKAKDLAVAWLRDGLRRIDPELAAAEETPVSTAAA